MKDKQPLWKRCWNKLQWCYWSIFGWNSECGKYRVVPVWIDCRFCGYEPQMKYTMGLRPGEFWTPLNRMGFWAVPDSFMFGYTGDDRYPQATFKEALDAVARSVIINTNNVVRPLTVVSKDGNY